MIVKIIKTGRVEEWEGRSGPRQYPVMLHGQRMEAGAMVGGWGQGLERKA